MILTSAIAADDSLTRLDERLARSPVRDGWIRRTDILEACASLYLEGDLVVVEDLVLHDAAMDIHPPTPALARAHMVLRARRRMAAALPGWGMQQKACEILDGRAEEGPVAAVIPAGADHDSAFGSELAAIDALLARSSVTLSRHRAGLPLDLATGRSADRFLQWKQRVGETAHLLPVEAAARTALAWLDLKPIENAAWLGPLLAADLLRVRKKTRAHLATVSLGLKAIAQAERRSVDVAVRLNAALKAIAHAADTGLRDHDRWLTARDAMMRRIKGRRSTSHLPELVELVIARPLVTSTLIARDLKISARCARDLVATLELRELTGRGRYQAWGVL